MGELNLDTASPDAPVRVGRYDVVGMLGRGGMGAVYEAIDTEHGTRVALKTLRRLKPGALLRFKQEFRQAADLSHPNLVSLYELSCEGDLWFFTMEYVDGRNFVSPGAERATLRDEDVDADVTGPTRGETMTRAGSGSESGSGGLSGPTPRAPRAPAPDVVEDLRSELRQLVRGVRALHEAGLLHLDIKPSNILVEPSGRVVLLDFGIARAFRGGDDSDGAPAGPADAVGTPAWMSPEQHDRGEMSEASDWYGVGLVLYTALTGSRAFRTHGVSSLAYAKRHVRPEAPSRLVDVPEDLSSLAMALLDPDPERRPTGEALLELVSGEVGRRPLPARRFALVGRDDERQRVLAAFEAAMDGGCAVVQVRGPSGVGKSALLRDLRERVSGREAIVLRGRCYERESVPYKAFDGMLDALARHVAARPAVFADGMWPEWTEELTRVFPVLASVPVVRERLATKMPIPASVPAREIQRRAVEALRELLANLGERHRCVVEIDDLQWADADSARALARLLEPPCSPGLLVALSYRPAEAALNPAVAKTLATIDALESSGLTRATFEIGPLGEDDAARLARATMSGRDLPPDLAQAIARAAAGVPFLVEELANLAAEQIDAGREPTVDLHDVITRRLASLAAEERALTEILAVADNPVPIAVAASVAGIEDRGVRQALASLRRRDFVRSTGARAADTIALRHDRLREQVVGLLHPERLDTIHAALGQALARHGEPDAVASPWLFDAVRHLNAGSARLDASWRVRAARLDLEAGRKARRSAAFGLAFACFESGTRLLPDDAWETAYDLALALHEGAADAAYLSATWDAVAHHVGIIDHNARSNLDRLRAWEARIDAAIARKEYAAAVDAGCEALARMGVELPANPGPDEVGAAFAAATQAIGEYGPEGFSSLPVTDDPSRAATMRIQVRITSAAYFARPALLPMIACRMVAGSVEHGLGPATPYALSIYGIVLNTLGMHPQAHAWGQVALALSDRFEDRSLDARTGHVVHNLVCNWIVPLATTLSNSLDVYVRGKAMGDVEYAAYSAHAYVHNAIYAGVELEGLLEQAIELGDFMRGHEQVNALHVHEPFEQLLRAFTGRTQDPARLDGDGFSEADALAAAEAAGSRSAMCLIRVVMGMARYHLGTPQDASAVFEAARPYLDGMPSVWHAPIFHQYAALSILALDEDARAPLLPRVEEALEALRALAEVAPMNFGHRVSLLEAELARTRGDRDAALEHCTDAIAGAREHHWPNDMGIALQITARCHADAGDAEAAREHLERARRVFEEWGASAKAKQLARELA